MGAEEIEKEIYDPYMIELQYVERLGAIDIKPDLANPQTVRFLAQQLTLRILELRTKEEKIDELQEKFEEIRNEREELRIELAKNQISWIEIPASILIGFSINLLTDDMNNVLGFVLLILGLAIVVFARSSMILKIGKHQLEG